MHVNEFRALLYLMMCSDPHPIQDEQWKELVLFANRQAHAFGYSDWIAAYHAL